MNPETLFGKKLQPYQRRIFDFLANVPDGHSITFAHGRHGTIVIATPTNGLTRPLKWNGKKWISL